MNKYTVWDEAKQKKADDDASREAFAEMRRRGEAETREKEARKRRQADRDRLEDRQRQHEHERLDREEQKWAVQDAIQLEREDVKDSVEDESFESYCESFDFEVNTGRQPAVLERDDGQTVLYSGRLNSIFGLPASGKSWVAIMAAKYAVMRGGNVMVLDFEDTAATYKARALILGFDPSNYWDSFRYPNTSMMASKSAVAEAQEWLRGASEPGQSLVVIDAAETAGCPSDGRDVTPWYKSHVDPWREVGAGTLFSTTSPRGRMIDPKAPSVAVTNWPA